MSVHFLLKIHNPLPENQPGGAEKADYGLGAFWYSLGLMPTSFLKVPEK